ncbi:MAG: hypothetical protein AAGD43_28585 [Pseudomonadota bacterium]
MSRAPKLAALAAIAILLPTPAFAYIDPAVGSMMLQGLIAAIAMAGTAWYTLRQKVGAYLSNAKMTLASFKSGKK